MWLPLTQRICGWCHWLHSVLRSQGPIIKQMALPPKSHPAPQLAVAVTATHGHCEDLSSTRKGNQRAPGTKMRLQQESAKAGECSCRPWVCLTQPHLRSPTITLLGDFLLNYAFRLIKKKLTKFKDPIGYIQQSRNWTMSHLPRTYTKGKPL